MAPQADQQLAGCGVPELDRLVRADGGDAGAIGVNGYAHGRILVSVEDLERSSTGDIPDTDGPVLAGRDQPPAVGAVRQTLDVGCVPLESDGTPPVSASQVWMPCRTRRDPPAVRAVRDRV